MVSLIFKDFLATTASISGILQFLAGIFVCRKFISNGTTGDTSGLAFVTCFMSCSLWLLYGWIIADKSIISVNLFGSVLQLSYAFIFILYSVKKTLIVKQLLTAVIFVTSVYIYNLYEMDRTLARQRIGLISCGLTILFFASPLTMLAHVFKVKSAESLPFPVILASLIVSIQWLIYGIILNDAFIEVPNLLGCILSGFQLSLFQIYPSKRADQIRLI